METNEADAMEAEGAEEEEIMEGEVALQEFQRVEADMGRQLTEEEHEFVDAQLEKNRILAIQSAKRSAEQSTRLKKLKNFIEHARKKLQDPLLIIEKPPAKTPAQRKATPAQKEANRVRMATPEQMEATRLRMGTPEQREASRVRKVVARSGSLSEDRRRDVEAGRKKNKKTSVYSGDVLRALSGALR